MAILNEFEIGRIIEEIQADDEVTRRALMQRRMEIFRDGGKRFLIEQITREFGLNALKEMRLAPVNLLKKIINKRSTLYKKSPTRSTELDSDQDLMDFYTEDMDLDELMAKANRYFTLFANTALYPVPTADGKLKLLVVPPTQYSIVPDPIDHTKIAVWIFNQFNESGRITHQDDVPSATGQQGFNREKGFQNPGKAVDSEGHETNSEQRRYIIWTDDMHATVDDQGHKFMLDPEQGDEQFINPIGMAPVVNLAKDRDNEAWAQSGDDMIDLSLAIQLGWTDLLTIAKHQGFSILTVSSEEEPQELKIGVARAMWLKLRQDGPTPSIGYVQGSSPLQEYKDILMDMTALLLSTNDMNPKEIGGTNSGAQSFSSGFQALIEMSDALEARKMDIPAMRRAEKELWQVIKAWHNYLFDQQVLQPDAQALGKFSESFQMSVDYVDVKPLESDKERLETIEKGLALDLLTPMDALRKWRPDLSDDELQAKMDEIKEVKEQAAAMFMPQLPAPAEPPVEEEEADGEPQS